MGWLLWVGLWQAAPVEAPDEDGVVVKGRRVAPPPGGSTAVDPGEARRIPGVAGDPAVAAQSLPAVARPALGSSALVVWGAAGSETRILIDGVPIPSLYHEGGLRSLLPPALPGALVLTPAGFGPEHGRAIGGLLEVETRLPAEEALRGEAQIDALDASALVEGRPHPQLSLLASGRYGWLDELLPALAPDAQVLVPPTVFRDWAARASWEEGREITSLLVLGATDAVDRRGLASEPGLTPRAHRERRFHRFILRHERPAGGATAWLGLDHASATEDFGPIGTAVVGDITAGGLRVWHRRGPLLLGLDAEAAQHERRRTGTAGLPRREGDDSVFGQSPGDGVAADAWTLDQLSAAAFARLDLRLFERLDLSPGLRVEPSFQRGDRRLPGSPYSVDTGYDRADFAVDPRLSAELAGPWGLALRAAGGRYRQLPLAADASPVFGGTDLEGPVAWHGLAGLRWRDAGFEAEAVAFLRRAESLTIRAASPTPALAGALEDEGEAKAQGIQLSLRLPSWRGLSGSAAYTLSQSERRDHTGWRAFEHDQRHGFSALIGQQFEHWRFGARFRLASGAPRPAVVGGIFDAAHGRFDPLFADEPERLPTFVQLDLDAEYRHEIDKLELSAYLSVLNATAHQQTEEYVYRFDYSARQPLSGPSTLAIAGLRLRFR